MEYYINFFSSEQNFVMILLKNNLKIRRNFNEKKKQTRRCTTTQCGVILPAITILD